MKDYKGYTIQLKRKNRYVIVSPYEEEIALLVPTRGHDVVSPIFVGLKPRNDYKHRGEILKDIANQHLALIGEEDEEMGITSSESKIIIIKSVKNLQINSNAFGIQINDSQVQQIQEAVDNASVATLKEVLKEWLPQACLGVGIDKLAELLGIVFS